MDDKTDTVRSNYAPDEECDSCDRHNDGLDGEQMPAAVLLSFLHSEMNQRCLHLVYGEPDRGQRNEPEQEEAHEIFGVGARGHWHVVGYVRRSATALAIHLDSSRMLLTLGHIALSMTKTQLPPILACTPYQILSIGISTLTDCESNEEGVPGHDPSIKYRPQASVQPKTGARNNWERYVKDSSRACVQDDEWRYGRITQPDTNPCLPP